MLTIKVVEIAQFMRHHFIPFVTDQGCFFSQTAIIDLVYLPTQQGGYKYLKHKKEIYQNKLR